MYQKDSIVAIATGSGSGGLGVIRISGVRAKDILEKVFLPKHGDNFCFRPRYMHYGSFVISNALSTNALSMNLSDAHNLDASALDAHLLDVNLSNAHILDANARHKTSDSFVLDEVLAVYFPAPYSFTGEDVAEIHAHGGSVLLHSMLEHIISLGARHAEAGEFTKRAFLNGRIDLAQAEAVAEIIAAPAIEGVRLAAAKIHGVLGKKIEDLRTQIEYIRRRICLAIDFPEEEGECLPAPEFHALVDILYKDISQLISAYDRAKPWSEGSLVVLVGQVNAGKSSLMNALLGRQRAIVTAEAGTTRDYLEEPSSLAGIPVRLTDTAGLREIAWVIQNYSQDESGLSPQILERLSHVLHSDMPYFASHGKNLHDIIHQDRSHNQDVKDGDVQDGDVHEIDVTKSDRKDNGVQDSDRKDNGIQDSDRKDNGIHESVTKDNALCSEKNISLIEVEGIRRSLELMEMADLVFLVFDGTKLLEHLNSAFAINNARADCNDGVDCNNDGVDCNTGVDCNDGFDCNNNGNVDAYNDQEKANIIAYFMQNELALLPKETKRICIWNKADIAPLSVNMLRILEERMNVAIFCISARSESNMKTESNKNIKEESIIKTESKVKNSQINSQIHLKENSPIQSMDDLAKFARSILLKQDAVADEIAPNRRQAGLLQSAKTELDYLKEEIDILPPDLTAIRLESCAQYLSTITGLCSVDDTFNAIFEEFCIGK